MNNVINNARLGDYAHADKTATISGYAQVTDNATVSGSAHVTDNATMRDHATISGSAKISGSAAISGSAKVSGSAAISGDVKIGDVAHVSGTAVVTEQHEVAWDCFDSRSGTSTLTLYMQENGSVGFTWGCRNGDDLRAYFAERPDYAEQGLDVEPLAFLEAFEQANGMGVGE